MPIEVSRKSLVAINACRRTFGVNLLMCTVCIAAYRVSLCVMGDELL